MGKAKAEGRAATKRRKTAGRRLPPGQVSFKWTLDEVASEREARTLTEALRKAGPKAEIVQHQTRPFFVVIPIIIAGIVVGVALGEQVYDWWENRHKHGLLIHVKPDGQVEIKPLESLPYGQVLFIGSDGVTFKYANVSQDKLKDILDAVSKGLTPPKP